MQPVDILTYASRLINLTSGDMDVFLNLVLDGVSGGDLNDVNDVLLVDLWHKNHEFWAQ
jgi:hypothetical protein